MNTFNTTNDTLKSASQTITKINIARITNVRDTIALCIQDANENKHNFTSKKNAIAAYIKSIELDNNADNYFKRAVKIAKTILVDGYKFKIELLTVAQMEQLSAFNKNIVNALMDFEDDLYTDAVKSLIKSAKIEKGTKVFSRAKAKAQKA